MLVIERISVLLTADKIVALHIVAPHIVWHHLHLRPARSQHLRSAVFAAVGDVTMIHMVRVSHLMVHMIVFGHTSFRAIHNNLIVAGPMYTENRKIKRTYAKMITLFLNHDKLIQCVDYCEWMLCSRENLCAKSIHIQIVQIHMWGAV